MNYSHSSKYFLLLGCSHLCFLIMFEFKFKRGNFNRKKYISLICYFMHYILSDESDVSLILLCNWSYLYVLTEKTPSQSGNTCITG